MGVGTETVDPVIFRGHREVIQWIKNRAVAHGVTPDNKNRIGCSVHLLSFLEECAENGVQLCLVAAAIGYSPKTLSVLFRGKYEQAAKKNRHRIYYSAATEMKQVPGVTNYQIADRMKISYSFLVKLLRNLSSNTLDHQHSLTLRDSD